MATVVVDETFRLIGGWLIFDSRPQKRGGKEKGSARLWR